MTILLAVVALLTSTFDLVTSSEIQNKLQSGGVSRGTSLSFIGAASKSLAVSLAGLIIIIKGSALMRDMLPGGDETSMWKTGVSSLVGSITCCTEEDSNRH